MKRVSILIDPKFRKSLNGAPSDYWLGLFAAMDVGNDLAKAAMGKKQIPRQYEGTQLSTFFTSGSELNLILRKTLENDGRITVHVVGYRLPFAYAFVNIFVNRSKDPALTICARYIHTSGRLEHATCERSVE